MQEKLEAKVGGLQSELESQTGELQAQNNDLQNNLQESIWEVEELRVGMASMVSADEQDTLGNFAYACAAEDFIWVVHRTFPGTDLNPLFYEVLAYLADNPPLAIPLPLLDLVDLGCEFSPEVELMEKLEFPIEQPAEQPSTE